MYARAVDEASGRLRELRSEERGDLGLAALALALAVGATQVYPALALPLFLGGIVVGALGVRALWRRWDLVDRLAAEPDAYAIAEVRAYASRETTLDRRRTFAAMIRTLLAEQGLETRARIEPLVEELAMLAAELEDERLTLEPASAVACLRLLADLESSPLLNPTKSPEELRSCVVQVRSGLVA